MRGNFGFRFPFFNLCLAGPFALLGIAATVFWIWMLIDAAMNEPSNYKDKVIWVIIIALTHVLGALAYFIIRRPQRRAQYGR